MDNICIDICYDITESDSVFVPTDATPPISSSSTTTAPPTTTSDIISTTTSSSPAPTNSSSNAGPIAGGVVGGIVGLAAIVGLAFLFTRRKRQPPPPTVDHEGNTVVEKNNRVGEQNVGYDEPPSRSLNYRVDSIEESGNIRGNY